jgi:PEP-CTERM motif
MLAVGVVLPLVGTAGADAGTLSFDFSFSNNGEFSFPSVDGEVTGEIIGLTNNATSAASRVYILSYPSGLGSSPPTPFNATGLPVFYNSFTVVDGVITGAAFFANAGSLAVGLLAANTNNFFRTSPSLITWNNEGLSGVTFTAVIPEPSTWAMMLLGFAGLGFAGHRQRQKLTRAASV